MKSFRKIERFLTSQKMEKSRVFFAVKARNKHPSSHFFKRLHLFQLWLSLLLGLSLLLPLGVATAQDQTPPSGPVYIVKSGDSLWDIALRFGVSLDDLEKANNITDPNQLAQGDRLVIPGLSGITGVLTTQTVDFGDSLRSLSRQYQIPRDTLISLNHLTSPAELYAGASLIVPEQNAKAQAYRRAVLAPGESLLELAVLQNANPWSLVNTNAISGTWDALPGDVLLLPDAQAKPGPEALPGEIAAVSVNPLPLVQGKTTSIIVSGQPGMHLGGRLLDYPLDFFPDHGGYVALQGIYALTDPGLYTLSISGTLATGEIFAFSQSIFVRAGDYPYTALTVDPKTIDPAVTVPEDAEWKALTAPVTPVKQWSGQFQYPVEAPFQNCFPSRFGERRSYNGSGYLYFHSGLDFCGDVGNKIFAAAAGTVVFSSPLTVRGNATLIDHGWGVYTAYFHQSKFEVKVGDHVQAGQEIGLIGNTGRVTGPHLHFEVIVGDIQVDPMDWLNQAFP
jgi:murein DD-endopeptidase MepM/ murein hydrolase activator NlpD